MSKFLHATPSHLVLGLQLLATLVTEMNGSANTRSLTQHRKVAGSFRDLALLSILQLGLTTLQQLQTGALAATLLSPYFPLAWPGSGLRFRFTS